MSWPYNSSADKPFIPVMIIHKSKAILCESCGNLTEGTNGHCVACGATTILPLAKVLEGKR